MIYYEVEKEEIIKYEVTINKEELEKIKNQVKQQHTEVTHIVKNSAVEPKALPGQMIKNLQKKYLFTITLDLETERDVYEFQYDSYMETSLVFLIDSLLEGNTNAIQEIKQFHKTQKKKNRKLSSYCNIILKSIKMIEVCRIPAQETTRLMEFFLNEINQEATQSEKLIEDENAQKQKRV